MSENNSLAVITETELNNVVVLPNHADLMAEVAELKRKLLEKEAGTVAQNSYGLNAERLRKKADKAMNPWDGILTDVSGLSLKDAIVKSGMDYTVEKVEMLWPGTGKPSGMFGLRRTDNGQPLTEKSVGNQYTPVQQIERWAFLEPVLEVLNLSLAFAGDLFGGQKSVIIAKRNVEFQDIRVGDAVGQYLVFSDSYDGVSGLGRMSEMIQRLRCFNGAIVNESANSWTFGHYKNATDRLEKIQKQIFNMNTDFGGIIEKYKFLASKPIKGDAQLTEYVEKVMGMEKKESKKTGTLELPTRTMGIRDEIISNIHGGFGNGQGDWYAAYNGVTQHTNHNFGRTRENRLDSLLFGRSVQTNQIALEVALQMAS